jgi:hypothetical protein
VGHFGWGGQRGGSKRAGIKVRNYEWTYYYSPETRSIVKYKYEDADGATREIELIKAGSE